MFTHKSTTGFDATSILSLGLYFLADQTGRGLSRWKLLGWFCNNVWYASTEKFRGAFFTSNFENLPANIDGPWTTTDQTGPIFPLDTSSSPMAIAPAGPRYFVDVEEKFIEWMDFSFYVGFPRDTVLALYHIKYRGDRILYVLGLQVSDKLDGPKFFLTDTRKHSPIMPELTRCNLKQPISILTMDSDLMLSSSLKDTTVLPMPSI